MKTSIEHLPADVQEKLNDLVSFILADVPEAQFIILYGSYAGNTYVEYDQKTEFGLRTCYKSDFDIVVLTPKKRAAHTSIMRRMDNARCKFYNNYNIALSPTIEHLAMHIEEFNDAIVEGRYFYTDIAQKGIILYNSGRYEIEPVRELNYASIVRLSQEYYNVKYKSAESFLYLTKAACEIPDYSISAFQLHQAVENYCLAIILSASLYAPKEHDITKIIDETARFTPIVINIFHKKTEEDERLLSLLQKAYIQARHNKDFVVTKKDIEALLSRVEQLRTEGKCVCLEKIEEHKQHLIDNNSTTKK